MKTSSLVGTVIAIILLVSLAAVWFYPSIQDFMESNNLWNGLKDFSDKYQVNHIDSLSVLKDHPQNSVLIEICYGEYDSEDLSRLRQFVESGNTLLLMDNFGYGNDVLQYLGVTARFNHSLLEDPLFCLKNPYFPRITDFTPEIRATGIQAIDFNHATVLDHVSKSQALAWSSNQSFLDLNQNGNKDNKEPAGPFVVAAEIQVGRGTLELVSNPSLIINSMVGQNDNYQFIDYLMNYNGQADSYLVDRSHLSKSPLDDMKIRWKILQKVLANPYATVGLVAVVFIIVIRYTLRKGDILG